MIDNLFYDVIIVGAGPAGIAAAHELLSNGVPGNRILILDMGPGLAVRVDDRLNGLDTYNVTGLGGAGLFSDGKITVPDAHLLNPEGNFRDLAPHVDFKGEKLADFYSAAYKLLTNYLLAVPVYERPIDATIRQMQMSFEEYGIDFRFRQVIQVPPNDLIDLIENLSSHLIESGVTIQLSTKLTNIICDHVTGIKHLFCLQNGNPLTLDCNFLVLAVGKSGMPWLVEQCRTLLLAHTSRPVEIGIRVEVPKSVLLPFTNVHKDLKLVKVIDDKTLVKTFCTCVGGVLAACQYDDMLTLGGYTGEKQGENTNFALLTKMQLDGVDTLEYGRSLIRTANILGEGKPIIQLLRDFKAGVATMPDDMQKNSVKTTLSSYKLADINLVYPENIINNLIATLDDLGKIIKGVDDDTNIVSAPCLERCYPKFVVDQRMETNIQGVFMAGDVAGNINGLLSSVASGILAAHGVVEKF